MTSLTISIINPIFIRPRTVFASQLLINLLAITFKVFSHFYIIAFSFFWNYQGNLYTEGRPWYHMCNCQPTVGLATLVVIRIFLHCSNSIFYSWLTTAHTVPWPSLCVKISLFGVMKFRSKCCHGSQAPGDIDKSPLSFRSIYKNRFIECW